jgi:CBS domain-containing protein/ribosome-associated translation inhibitor RaiA
MVDSWPLASEMMSSDPITADVSETLSHALGTMRSKRIHEIPVLRDGKLVGMVTYDALGRRHTLSFSTKLENVMVLAPTVPPGLPYPQVAEQLLSSGRRAACVVDPRNGKLLGVVSRTDLVRLLPTLPELADHLVSEVMSPATLQIRAEDSTRDVLAHLRELEEHPLPVIDHRKRLVGAVGLWDVGNALWHTSESGQKDFGESTNRKVYASIESIMSRPALTVERGATVGEAAKLMTRNRASTVFVSEGDSAMGIVSQIDLLGLAVRHAPPSDSVYIQISGLGASADPTLASDLDAVLSKGLKRIARAETPRMLSVHVVPHAANGLGSITVEARLHGPHRIFNASRTDFALLKASAAVMEELERQVRGNKEGQRERGRSQPRSQRAEEAAEVFADPDLDRKLPESLSSTKSGGSARRRRP